MPVGDIVPEITLVLGAAAVLLFAVAAPRRHQPVAAGIAGATVVAAGALTVDLARRTEERLTFDGTWSVDGAALAAELVILALTAVVIVMSPEWFASDARHGEYYAVLLLGALGAIVMASAADTMELVVGVLLSSVTGYTLAAYHRGSPASTEAGTKFFVVGALTNALLLLGVVVLFGVAGTTLYDGTARAAGGGDPVALAAASVLVAVGLAFKMGAVPAHSWMPDVAQGSPVPSAAFLTVVPKVGAVVGLARILSLLPEDAVGWRPLAAALAAVTMTAGNLGALGQDDVRRLLGWSAVSQSGYALMALPALDRADLALPALLLFVLAYGLANVAAFAVVAELRGRTALADFRGLGASRPWLGAALTVSLLSLVGIPPLAGFAGKLTLFAAAIDSGYAWLAGLAVANTVASLFYYLRVVAPVYFEPGGRPVAVLGRWTGGAALGTAAAVVVVGVAAEPVLHALDGVTLLP